MLRQILSETRRHMPFTAAGSAVGIALLLALYYGGVGHDEAEKLFWVMHPAHVFLSAMATTALYKVYAGGRPLPALLIGYTGSVGIATLSDSVIPFIGEIILKLPQAHVHAGFIEQWWLVNPVALAGIALGWYLPRSRYPHAGHVLLSTTASLLHMLMALGGAVSPLTIAALAAFLFLAVWLPCCTSDIVYPLLWVRGRVDADGRRLRHGHAH